MGENPSATRSDPYSAPAPVTFTPAEARVLPLLATHLTLEGIAERLGVRRPTVKTHVVSIYKKLGVANRAQAVERAAEAGILPAATPAVAVSGATHADMADKT